jgi:hypothetical protein
MANVKKGEYMECETCAMAMLKTRSDMKYCCARCRQEGTNKRLRSERIGASAAEVRTANHQLAAIHSKSKDLMARRLGHLLYHQEGFQRPHTKSADGIGQWRYEQGEG